MAEPMNDEKRSSNLSTENPSDSLGVDSDESLMGKPFSSLEDFPEYENTSEDSDFEFYEEDGDTSDEEYGDESMVEDEEIQMVDEDETHRGADIKAVVGEGDENGDREWKRKFEEANAQWQSDYGCEIDSECMPYYIQEDNDGNELYSSAFFLSAMSMFVVFGAILFQFQAVVDVAPIV